MIRVSNRVQIYSIPTDERQRSLLVESTDTGSSVYLRIEDRIFEVSALDLINAVRNAMNCGT